MTNHKNYAGITLFINKAEQYYNSTKLLYSWFSINNLARYKLYKTKK